jgi:hypothetical protein
MPRDASDSPAAQALRQAGFVKCPSWWITQDQLELIEYLARQNLDQINSIKDRINQCTSYAREKLRQ